MASDQEDQSVGERLQVISPARLVSLVSKETHKTQRARRTPVHPVAQMLTRPEVDVWLAQTKINEVHSVIPLGSVVCPANDNIGRFDVAVYYPPGVHKLQVPQ